LLCKDLNFSGVAVTYGARAPLLGGFVRDDFGRGEDLPEWARAVVEYAAVHKIRNIFLTRRASDQARCIVRAEGLRERDAGCLRLVRKYRLVIPAAPWAFGKGWCPVGAA
jgi:hypothetical protein